MIADLLAIAGQLVLGNAGLPKQVALRRAVSSAYYAVFHAQAQSNADALIGSSKDGRTWHRVYRALEHVAAKKVLVALVTGDKTHPALNFAQAFVDLQEKRHEADYDPACSFDTMEAALLVLKASDGIANLNALPRDIRLDLATRTLFKTRS